METVRDKQYAVLKRVYDQNRDAETSDGFNLTSVLAQLKTLKGDLRKTFTSMNLLKSHIEGERQEIRAARAEEAQRRKADKHLSVVFLLIELLVTGGLIAFFLEDISKRLKKLVGNARLLPEEKPLSVKVGGEDEIAYLDSVLHEASEKLLEAKQNRQSIVNMIAHDIRSPLMSSNLLLDALARQTEEGDIEKCRATNESLKQTYKEMLVLVEDFLALERNEAKLTLSPELIDVSQLVSSVIAGVQIQADRKNLTIQNLVTAEKLVADPMRIRQVLNNLISNAIKHTNSGGKIAVTSEETGEFLKVSVKDTGTGIAAEDVPKLFDRFFQARNTADDEGFGLGLAITKMIVQSHGGSVGAESQVGEGSTFWFTLPTDSL